MKRENGQQPTELQPPLQWQRVLGVVVVFLVALNLAFFGSVGESLKETIEPLEIETQAYESFIILTALYVRTYWMVWFPVLLLGFIFWISRKWRRMLWFNALLAVGIPLLLILSLAACVYRSTAIQEMLRSQ